MLAITIPLAVIAVGGFVVWSLFFKPLTPAEYEMAIEDGLVDLEEGSRVMGEAIRDLVQGSNEKMSAADISRYQSDFAAGESVAREASQMMRELRVPDEYQRLHRDVEAYVAFMVEDVIDPLSEFTSNLSARNSDADDVSRELVRIWERASRGTDAAKERHGTIIETLYISSVADPLQGLALSPVKVTVSWEQPVDVDLRVYDLLGDDQYTYAKDRDAGGDPGEQSETIVFTELEQYDLSEGTYRISAYFAGRSGSNVEDVFVTVTLTLPTGATVERERWVGYDGSEDEWHVFEIDAATGDYSELGWVD